MLVSSELYFGLNPSWWTICKSEFHLGCLLLCYRSMHKLTQLERLDLGNNEFSELVRNAPIFDRKLLWFGGSGDGT